MVNTCCIRNCKTNKIKSSEISFFKFPTSERLRKVWEDRVGPKGFKADANTLLCSRHFVKGRVHTLGDRRVLLKNSIPTQCLGNGDVEMDACVADTEEPKDTGKKSGYKCLVCHEMVHRMYEFLTDAHAHRCFSQRQLICGHCLVGFPNFSDLMSHVTQIGADRRYVPEASASPGVKISNYTRFPCSLCSAYFTSSSARDVHEARHARKNVPVPVPTPQSLEVRSAEGARAQAGGEQTTQNGAQRKPPGIAPSRRELSHYATTVVCSLCNYSFVNLRRLDEHYRSCHGAAPLPLDLVFEEDFEYTLRPETLCSVCVKRRSCVDTIQRLLEEATKDGI
ncbi:uncharacterized protein LOC8034326 [Ixodes scapularis]|uniref:uncharacterized protein LOC8034326 n=1 Tax=Ixodes scapularis TaxID=6945 RepID=UPI001C3957E9|nr:uncharacterized protein LOC8034326 [Ixodes scapularis]